MKIKLYKVYSVREIVNFNEKEQSKLIFENFLVQKWILIYNIGIIFFKMNTRILGYVSS